MASFCNVNHLYLFIITTLIASLHFEWFILCAMGLNIAYNGYFTIHMIIGITGQHNFFILIQYACVYQSY